MTITRKLTMMKNRRKLWLILSAVLALFAVVTGSILWKQSASNSATPTQAAFQTAQVRRGNLMLSASGTGTLIAAREAELSFPVSGKISAVYVKAGDQVSEGQVLAELDDGGTLSTALKVAELELRAAEQALREYKENAASRLAEAQLAVAEAEEAYQEAKEDLKQPGVARCDQDTTDAYYETYMKTQRELDALGDGGGSKEYYLSVIVPAKNRVAQAYAAYAYCAGFTDYEIDASHAQLALAEAQLKTAQETLKTLQENSGIDPEELAKLENELASAQLAYNKAKTNLEKATMRAPFAGTILSVSGQAGDEVEVGDEVSTSTFITIVDLYHPRVEFSIDETDLDKVSVGNDAEVVFDALPNRTFKGSVIQVNPSLETESGYQVLKGIIQLELEAGDNPALFLVGMNASVEIIGGKAENALLVPVEAVRDLGNGEYGVFVIGSDGKARLKVVEVGLMDATYAEIKSGLNAGDVVTTGTMETQS